MSYFNHQKALLRKKIKTALKEQIEARDDLPEEEKDNSPEIVQKFINSTPSQTSLTQPPASTTPPSDASDVQEKETKKKKPRRAKDRYLESDFGTDFETIFLIKTFLVHRRLLVDRVE